MVVFRFGVPSKPSEKGYPQEKSDPHVNDGIETLPFVR